MDASTSIDEIPGAWATMITFMEAIVNKTTVGLNLTRFGFIIFTDDPTMIFTLDKYKSKTEILQEIRKLNKPDGNTETAKALEYSIQYFDPMYGGRAALGVEQILMLITDGGATTPRDLPKAAAALRDNGINVLSIGIKEANVTQLETIAGGDKSKVFFVDNFNALDHLHRNISDALCHQIQPGMLPGSPDVDPTNGLCHFTHDVGLDAHQ